jgi:hypothetical protein
LWVYLALSHESNHPGERGQPARALPLHFGGLGGILTELPKKFPLQKGDSLEIYQDEILYKA